MRGDPFTEAIHADDGLGDGVDLSPPIHVTTTYDRTEQTDLVYRRDRHPTTERLETVLGALEGGDAVCYPSGMAAIAALLRHLRPGRVAIPDDLFHGTRSFITAESRQGAWEVVDAEALDAGDVWWVETPSNPKCLITDIEAVAAEARARGCSVVVDSTLATPIVLRPLEWGAAFVVHSTTKFIGGHSDALGGVVVGRDAEEVSRLRAARNLEGSVPGALDVWLTLRGVRTLPLRVRRQCETADAVARYLEHRVPRVWYPGLAGHPGHDVAARQLDAPGAVLSVELEDEQRAKDVLARLRLFRRATSLGGVESLVEHRRSVNLLAPPGLLRFSIGLEAPEDLIEDLEKALPGKL